jgi:ribosomal protein S18 acetylase RimI-like enzyme
VPDSLYRPWQRTEDSRAVHELAALLPDEAISAAALPYHLSSWACDDPENLALWTTPDGALMAFALFQLPFGSVHFAIHPRADRSVLEDAIFVWSKERAAALANAMGETVSFSIWPAEKEVATHARLAAQGFTRQENHKVFFSQLLHTPPPAPTLPAGFSVRPLAGIDEVEAAAELLCIAFNITTVTPTWRRRILEQPTYRPELDLVIAAPDGRLAAFCLLWLHPHGHTGQIEPMATHPEFQRMGLGRAAIYTGLAQVAALGATRVVVGTGGNNHRSQGMYQSTGFRLHHRRIGYQFSVTPSTNR